MKVLDTMKAVEFARALEGGEFDDGNTALVVSTSDDSLLRRIEEAVGRHGLLDHALAMGYDDVEDPDIPSAFTDDMARMVRVFIADHAERTSALLPACDGGMSRSAAMMAATIRLAGGGDLACWTDSRYCPNVLVYRLIMRAAGVQMTDAQVEARRRLERTVADRKARKLSQIHAMRVQGAAFEELVTGGETLAACRLEGDCLRVLPGDAAAVVGESRPDDIAMANAASLHVYGNLDDALADWGSAAALELPDAIEGEANAGSQILVIRLRLR